MPQAVAVSGSPWMRPRLRQVSGTYWAYLRMLPMPFLLRLTPAVSDFRVQSDMDMVVIVWHPVFRRTSSPWAPPTLPIMASFLRMSMGSRVILKGRIHIPFMSHRGQPLATRLNPRDFPLRGHHLTYSPTIPPPTLLPASQPCRKK